MRHLSWQIRLMNGLVISGMLLGWADLALAQRRPIADETLGDERSIVTPQDNIRGLPGDRIEGGARRGDNLFHSFQEFNVDAGRAVYFADPDVQNILGRVTGGTASEILGRLGVLGNANLFLINPSGIIFGEGASLDVSGSFVATTANAMQFGEQGFFSATDPTAPPLLTVQPSAFLFNRLNPAPIANSSKVPAAENRTGVAAFGLQVPAGESLALLGGNVSMDGGGLVALGGRVEIGGLSQPGTVTYNADRSLGFLIGVARSDVTLTNQSRINAVGDGGSITVNARALEIVDSDLSAGIGSNSGFVGAQAGDITLNAIDIRSGGRASIANLVGDGGVGNGGDIHITTGSLFLTNGAQLQAVTLGQGNAGNITICAQDHVLLEGGSRGRRFSAIFTVTGEVAQGRGGGVSIVADSIHLINGGRVSSETSNDSSGGTVTLNAKIFEATTGGQVVTATSDRGQAGNIILNADDRITLAGTNPADDLETLPPVGAISDQGVASGLYATTARNSLGQGGAVRLTTKKLQVFDRARIAVDSRGSGSGGDIDITASTVQLDDRARITADTVATNGGNITLRDSDILLLLNNSLIATTVGTAEASGGEGNITLNPSFLFLDENSAIVASSSGESGGTINLTITNADLSRSLLELPENVVDPSGQLAQTCPTSGNVAGKVGEFVVTGRGGLPPSPIDSLIGEESLFDWSTLNQEGGEERKDRAAAGAIAPPNPAGMTAGAIVEAQGWMRGEDGNVKLIAAAPIGAVQPPAMCP